MKTLHFILGDQLSLDLSSLKDISKTQDVVLMVEVGDETTYTPHHKQKIVLVLSAMRHFAQTLRDEGITVDYIRLDDKQNTHSFSGELKGAMQRHKAKHVTVTEPGEWRVWQMMQQWQKEYSVEIRSDDRFLCSRDEFAAWSKNRKQLRMEFFYREMRRKTGWLMHGVEPEGGQWNFDASNRKPLPKNVSLPQDKRFEPDATTQAVMDLVGKKFSGHFGDLESFGWAVTRADALEAMHHFMTYCLPTFGDYQDAMKQGQDFLFHAILSPYINLGLLNPKEVCEAALEAYHSNKAPLASTEGFIRQMLGWREYIRGIYWTQMPDYPKNNFFEAKRPLPAFYWNAKTDMNCMHETIVATQKNAYAHHIQRLMITGNFALLAGISPAQVEEWYLAVYADAYEWVELPNTHGMALYADGGLLASKPYAASGAYIDRMSDYCQSCAYSPKIKLGDKACPFNYLYWYFLIENQKKLKANPRMAIIYKTLDKMPPEQRSTIVKQAESFLVNL